MKQSILCLIISKIVVAPRAGAWIETIACEKLNRQCRVAPRAGAWIETENADLKCANLQVAPRAGAWIETVPLLIFSRNY